ncbi:MAG: 5'/3'-nucleotidase SurE [Deltaproteobacteria bacterium]|nr:5'/3'-nucleotidase SurE [Deltaproteobacteria bacterium]
MNILLTNDDGIHAPGLMALYNELKKDFHLEIVAPVYEMSAVGHAITLASPLRVKTVDKNGTFYGYGVEGTPADCVKIAVQEIMRHPPDIILSGINLGANVGINVLYSGTVSAATEGAFLGIRSAAISLNTRREPDFGYAASFSREIIQFMTTNGLNHGTALNVNIPAVKEEEISGVEITRQSLKQFKESFERRVDPRGNIYYWLSGERPVEEDISDADAVNLKENKISITPIHYDLTNYKELERLKSYPRPQHRLQKE